MPEIFDSSQKDSISTAQPDGATETIIKVESPAQKSTQSNMSSNNTKNHRKVEDYSQVMRDEVHCTNPLEAFIPQPPTMRFSNQAETETIILLLRQHPVSQLKWVFIAILLALLPLLFSSIDFLGFLPATYKLAITISWFMLVIGFVLESFLKWFFNIFILTDERVIDIDFLSLMYKNESSAKIDNIEDITATMGGVARSVFNYGTVKVQTSAATVEFEFEDVPQPNKVVKLINELILEEEREELEGRVN